MLPILLIAEFSAARNQPTFASVVQTNSDSHIRLDLKRLRIVLQPFLGGVLKILGRYAPQSVREFAASGNYDIKYLPYNWGLNDQGAHGRNYSRVQLIFDNLFK